MRDKILSIIKNLPNIAFIIYQEKIVFANKCALEKLEYTEDEILEKSIEDLVSDSLKEKVKKIKERRLKGEIFEEIYFDLPIKTKKNSLLICAMFAYTIEYNGKYSGFVIALDITEKIILERTINLIGKVHELTTKYKKENDFLIEVCRQFKETLDIELSVIIKSPKKNKKLDFLYICGERKFNVPFMFNKILYENISLLRKNEIIIKKSEINDFPSFSMIPIKIDKKLSYVIIIFSQFLNFMENLNLELLNKLKVIIKNSIEKINKDTHIEILYNALENSPDCVMITDKYGKIIYANKTVERLSKYSVKQLKGKTINIFISKDYDSYYKEMWKVITSGKTFSGIAINKDKYGKLYKLEQTVIPVKKGNEISHFVIVGKDLTIEEELKDEIFTLKYKDLTTGLFNRNGFFLEVQNMINNFKFGEKGILVILDIYNFSYINNIYSENVGDEILREIANFLLKINKDAVIGKIGGDDFAIFKKIDGKYIVEYVESLLEILKISKFSSHEIVLGFNIGAAIYPDDSSNLNQLITNATTSLNIAKSKGENTFEFFNEEIAKLILKKKEEKELIVNALENDWFEVFLQPYFYIKDLKLAGFEALLRIRHPERGILTPYYFIDTLEESEYLFDVEKFLIRSVCETLLIWKSKYKNVKPISINLTAKSFKNNDIISYLMKWINKLNEPLLNIELTERLFIENFDFALNIIQKLKKSGVIVSLDDFGTGYSSLSYLTEIPIEIIKIDITFIRKMFEDEKTKAIVEVIISLAKKIGLKTIAEGVETKEQLEYLKKLGCDIAQGYLLGKPCPMKEAENYFNL